MRSLDSNVLFSVREYRTIPFQEWGFTILLCSVIAVSITLISPSVGHGQTWIVRDRAGKVTEKKVQSGDRVKVYDPSGRLI